MKETLRLFRPVRDEEAANILALYRSVVGSEFCTWNDQYPGMLEICADMKAGNLFVLEEGGKIIGAASIVPENELDELECWTEHENAGEIARIVIAPEAQERGLSGELVGNLLSEMRSRGVRRVHLAVAKVNLPARKTYAKLGFRTVGEAEMYGNSFYLCEIEL